MLKYDFKRGINIIQSNNSVFVVIREKNSETKLLCVFNSEEGSLLTHPNHEVPSAAELNEVSQ